MKFISRSMIHNYHHFPLHLFGTVSGLTPIFLPLCTSIFVEIRNIVLSLSVFSILFFFLLFPLCFLTLSSLSLFPFSFFRFFSPFHFFLLLSPPPFFFSFIRSQCARLGPYPVLSSLQSLSFFLQHPLSSSLFPSSILSFPIYYSFTSWISISTSPSFLDFLFNCPLFLLSPFYLLPSPLTS